MPFFYKSNLTNDGIPFLNPSENDLDLEKNKADLRENINRENGESNLECASFPYKDTIRKLHILLKTEIIIFYFMIFLAYITLPPMDEIRFHKKIEIFYESCDARNIIPLYEVNVIKDQIDKFYAEKDIVNVMIGYNISAYTNYCLNQKLVNLSNSINGFKKQIEEQKEIRYICVKKNVEKKCKDQFLLKIYENYSTVIHFYISILVISSSITYFYILKARKIELSSKQKFELYMAEEGLYVAIVINIIITLLFAFLSWKYDQCNVEGDLKRFKM